jgi:hypothetical protein
MRSIALVLFCCAACYGGFEPYRLQDSCTCQLADGGIFGRDLSWFACDERSASPYVCHAQNYVADAGCASPPVCTCQLETGISCT